MMAASEEERNSTMTQLVNMLWHGDLLKPHGCTLPAKQKLEQMLQLVVHRRATFQTSQSLNRHSSRSFTDDDMKLMWGLWYDDIRVWMRADILQKYRELKASRKPHSGKHAHELKKRSFNSYLHEQSGCKRLLLALIQYPAYHSPSAVAGLLHKWQNYQQTEDSPPLTM